MRIAVLVWLRTHNSKLISKAIITVAHLMAAVIITMALAIHRIRNIYRMLETFISNIIITTITMTRIRW